MSDEMRHILVVDDDERLRRLLTKYLSDHGYMATAAADAEAARRLIAAMTFDLIILDVMMPGESGLELTRSLRENSAVPILLLTAMGEASDRILGLESGADDYLPKPFEPKELLLRVGGILRRVAAIPERNESPKECRFGRFVFDLERSELRDQEQIVHLTTGEAALLGELAKSPGEILSREELAERTGAGGNLRAIDVQITRLRRKIEEDQRQPRSIQTMRGQGYVLWPNR